MANKLSQSRRRRAKVQIKIVCPKRKLKDLRCWMSKHLVLTGALPFMSNKVQSFTKSKGVRMAAMKSHVLSITLRMSDKKKRKPRKDVQTISKEVNKENTTKSARITTRNKKNTTMNIMTRKRMKKKTSLQKYGEKVKIESLKSLSIMLKSRKLK